MSYIVSYLTLITKSINWQQKHYIVFISRKSEWFSREAAVLSYNNGKPCGFMPLNDRFIDNEIGDREQMGHLSNNI